MSESPPPRTPDWGTCPVCGDAVPPTASQCPTCHEPVSAVTAPRFPGVRARWARLLKPLRVILVVGVVLALAYAIISPTLSGPPSVSDPLTTQSTYVIGPGNSSYLGGAITGEDYVVGNYTVVNPAGASIGMAIYNSSDFAQYLHGQPTKAAWTVPPQSTGRIVFAAPYTDQFYFVFTNPYAGATGIVEHVYVVTNYQSNVLVG